MRKSVFRSAKIFCTSLLIGVLLLSGCSGKNSTAASSQTTATNRPKDEIIVSIGGESTGWDPCTGWGQYFNPLFQSKLMKICDKGLIENDLATDYTISEDGLQWTFTIRDDVRFTDGESLTAEDVAFTYNTCKQAGSKVDLTIMEKVEAINDTTVVFTLVQPASTFLYKVASIGIVPSHLYDANYNENPVGSGPYKFVQWDKGQQLILEYNEDYYGPKPNIHKIVMLFMDQDTAFAAAQKGTVDVVFTNPSLALHEIDGYQLVTCDAVDSLGISFPMLSEGNVNADGMPIGNNVTSDLAIRKACSYGVDRNKLCKDVINGFGSPAYSTCDNMAWFNEETIIPEEQSGVEAAAKILEDGGWIDTDGDGIREKDGVKAEFNIIYPSSKPVRQTIAFAFAEQCKPLGIHVTTEGMSWDDVFLNWSSNAYVLSLGEFSPNELYECTSSATAGVGYSNPYYYRNKTVDGWMQAAMAATNEEEANEFWKKSQWDGVTGSSMIGDAPVCWLVNTNHLYFVRDGLSIGSQRIHTHGEDGVQILDNIEEWAWTK